MRRNQSGENQIVREPNSVASNPLNVALTTARILHSGRSAPPGTPTLPNRRALEDAELTLRPSRAGASGSHISVRSIWPFDGTSGRCRPVEFLDHTIVFGHESAVNGRWIKLPFDGGGIPQNPIVTHR